MNSITFVDGLVAQYPRDGERVAWHEPGNRYSTTLRIHDPAIDAWHIAWFDPPSGAIVRQLGRRVGEEIVQMGPRDDSGPWTRRVYRDISANRFRCCNETSRDHGRTWLLVQEMRALRVCPSPHGAGLPRRDEGRGGTT